MRKPLRRTPAWLPAVATVGAIALIVATFLVIRYYTTPAPPPAPSNSDTQVVLATITSLPASELEQVGLGSADVTHLKATGDPVLKGPAGKPLVFYYGAEYCPYCAAERWAIIIALSRFGSFTGLQTTTSSSSDIFPNTPTFTFRNAKFTSDYIEFQAVETTDRDQNPLQTPTAQQQALVGKYDPSGSIPFTDFANRYTSSGATYSPGVLSGMSWIVIADQLKNPDTPEAKGVLGSANLFTAALCKLTSNQPAAVCGGAAIQSIETRIG